MRNIYIMDILIFVLIRANKIWMYNSGMKYIGFEYLVLATSIPVKASCGVYLTK